MKIATGFGATPRPAATETGAIQLRFACFATTETGDLYRYIPSVSLLLERGNKEMSEEKKITCLPFRTHPDTSVEGQAKLRGSRPSN